MTTSTNNSNMDFYGMMTMMMSGMMSMMQGGSSQSVAPQSTQSYYPSVWQAPQEGPQPIYGFPSANAALMPSSTLYNMVSDNYQLTSKYMSPVWGMPLSQSLAMGYNPFATDNQFSNNPMQLLAGMFMQAMGAVFGIDTSSSTESETEQTEQTEQTENAE